jgi:hypothetical protein
MLLILLMADAIVFIMNTLIPGYLGTWAILQHLKSADNGA